MYYLSTLVCMPCTADKNTNFKYYNIMSKFSKIKIVTKNG